MNLFKTLKQDQKLKKFLHIIEDSPVYPVFYDQKRTVLSLPPIINSDSTKEKKLMKVLNSFRLSMLSIISDLNKEMTEVFTTENEYQHSEIKRGNDRIKTLEDLFHRKRMTEYSL